MDVLRMIEIVSAAYETCDLQTAIYQNVNNRESFQGILIESYETSLFCDKLITPFGMLRVSNGGCIHELKEVEKYIKSRISYRKVLDVLDNKYHGCVGPFYLVTHIDGEPVKHASLKGFTYDSYSTFVKPNMKGRDEYPNFIESCIHKRLIRDKKGILNDLLLEPDSYPSFVKYLAEGLEHQIYAEMLCEDKLFHVFGLLLRKKMLLF